MALTLDKLEKHISDIRDRLNNLKQEQIDKLDEGMAIDPEEHFQFQQLQAQMHASGVLSAEAAQLIYTSLGVARSGHNGGWNDGVDTATKLSITQLMAELLGAKIATRS